jgi:hypothetical protein
VSELGSAGVSATGLVATANCFNVGRSIAAAADEWSADVIVVGSRRRSRWSGLRGKSMREQITGVTSLPVMTAPPPLRVGFPRRAPSSERVIPLSPRRSSVSTEHHLGRRSRKAS